jgi:hypothetical protein
LATDGKRGNFWAVAQFEKPVGRVSPQAARQGDARLARTLAPPNSAIADFCCAFSAAEARPAIWFFSHSRQFVKFVSDWGLDWGLVELVPPKNPCFITVGE